jgi:hypothetical protein
MGGAYTGLPASSIRVVPRGFGVDRGGRRRATIPYSIIRLRLRTSIVAESCLVRSVLQHEDDFIMPTSGKPLSEAIDLQQARRSSNPRLVAFALALCAVVLALLVDRAAVVGALQGIGHALEYAARLIASVEIPFG